MERIEAIHSRIAGLSDNLDHEGMTHEEHEFLEHSVGDMRALMAIAESALHICESPMRELLMELPSYRLMDEACRRFREAK